MAVGKAYSFADVLEWKNFKREVGSVGAEVDPNEQIIFFEIVVHTRLLSTS